MRVARSGDAQQRPRPGLGRRQLAALARAFGVLGALAGFTACAPLDTDVPRGFDLSGEWILVEGMSDGPPDITAIRRREDRAVVRGRQANARGSAAFVVQDFPVLGAERLSIEQNADSMGIRYDEGVYRDISWGVRERDFWTVRVGWEEGALVIRSQRGETNGVERLALEDAGSRLRVTAKIDTEGEDVRVTRVYRRR